MVQYLDEADVRALLRWEPLIAAMEPALAAFSAGRVLQPVRNMLVIEEGKRYLGIMPAVAEEAMGLKLVSFYPGNAGTAIPTHLAMILLFRPRDRRATGGNGRPPHNGDANSGGFRSRDQTSGSVRDPYPGSARQRRASKCTLGSTLVGPRF